MVLWVVVKLVGQELDLVDKMVAVISVSVSEQELALVVELIPLSCSLVP